MTVWKNLRTGKHLVKIVRKYSDNNKVFYDECGNVYYTHRSMNCPIPFWIEKVDCCKTPTGSPNTYFKPRCYFGKSLSNVTFYESPLTDYEKSERKTFPLNISQLIDYANLIKSAE